MAFDLSDIVTDPDLGEEFCVLRSSGEFAAGGWVHASYVGELEAVLAVHRCGTLLTVPVRARGDVATAVGDVDGGIEAAATRQPYACDHSFFGYLTWEPDALVEAMERVVRRGWRIGTHAYGDRAVATLLDAYAELTQRHPALPPRSLVLEHGGFADAGLRNRAITLGIPVTIQQPLLHDTARVEDTYWGPDRVSALFPARQWIDEGALVTAGSDYPAGTYGAMQSVWGLVTRQTVTGVRGPEHAITVDEAIALHTVNAATLLGESALRGALAVGRLADLTIWDLDPTTCTADRLRGLQPTHTVVGGRLVHSPPRSEPGCQS